MANIYFDNNLNAAGFGTLNGTWDNGTTVRWTTSAAGNIATIVYTFTNADTAIFGAPPATATAGSVTVANLNTINLNKLQYNLAGQQTISGTGSGNLTFSGISPSIVNLGAGQPIISAPINFPSGLDFLPGAGAIVLTNIGQPSNSGTVSISDGTVYLQYPGPGTPDQLKGATAFALAQSARFTSLQYYGSVAYTEPASFSATFASTADQVGVFSHNNAGVTLTHSSVGTFIGTFGALAYATSNLTGRLVLNTAPASAGALYLQSTNLTTSQTGVAPVIVFNHSGTATISALIYLSTVQASTSLAGVNYVLEQNSAGLTTFNGNVVTPASSNASAFQWLRLSGTGLSALAGNYAPTLGTSGLRKLGSGQWNLSGANTYTGSTLVDAGTLSARSASAFGSSTNGVVTQTGGTIEVTNDTALNKGTLGLTLISVAGSTALKSTSGTNSFTCGAVTLSSTIPVDVSSGASLALNNSSAITGGGFGIAKNGDGEFSLPAVNNTYTGAVTINAGTLSVGSVAAIGVASALGTGAGTSAISVAGTLKFTGTSAQSTDRSLTLSGGSPTIDASGTGVGSVTYSAATQANTTKTITFTGSGTNNNTASFNIGDTSFVTSLSKAGVGKWILTGGTLNYTGTTTVSAGTLNLGSANRALTGGVSISGGTIENGTSTLNTNVTMTGGTITAVLTGTGKTLGVTSGTATINPASADGSNTFTGTSTISSGATLKLISSAAPSTSGNGKALGDSTVAVNGKIETGYSQTQRGQIRFGGSVTFGNGSEIHIGAAA